MNFPNIKLFLNWGHLSTVGVLRSRELCQSPFRRIFNSLDFSSRYDFGGARGMPLVMFIISCQVIINSAATRIRTAICRETVHARTEYTMGHTPRLKIIVKVQKSFLHKFSENFSHLFFDQYNLWIFSKFFGHFQKRNFMSRNHFGTFPMSFSQKNFFLKKPNKHAKWALVKYTKSFIKSV